MKKVLLFQNTIPHYRVPIFEELGRKVDLTVVCDTDKFESNPNYKTVKVGKCHIPRIGDLHDRKLIRMIKESDVVVGPLARGNLVLDFCKFLVPQTKIVRWGIGVAASYTVRYDSCPVPKFIHYIKKADAAVFYSEYPREKYAKLGIPKEKMFVANNTVRVENVDSDGEKDCLLFVGSLYKQKRVDVLLEHYQKAMQFAEVLPDLYIIGDGDERQALIEKANDLGISSKVHFCGQIIEETELSKYFARAYACISPDQAGLSVLKSMGYGVPFVTLKDAITGGEIFNIRDRYNGILLDREEEMYKIILDIAQKPEKYAEYGKRARAHYQENRRPEQMAAGILDAIEYVLRDKEK